MKLNNNHSSESKLITLLRDTGIGSRRACFNLIKEGKVSINGIIASNSSEMVVSSDSIFVNGTALKKKSKFIYIKLNKPTGVLTSLTDDRGRETVFELLPYSYKELSLFPIGRLDMYTSGLLLLTNDGHLALRLTHPRYEIEKEYYVTLKQNLQDYHANALSNGIMLENVKTAPSKIVTLDKYIFKYSITVHEGKKRQIRLMFSHFGYSIQSLQRVRIHNIHLGDLIEGEIQNLTKEELKVLIDEKLTDPKFTIDKI
jgi:23S rRNA pseudouridine2605 synthase